MLQRLPTPGIDQKPFGDLNQRHEKFNMRNRAISVSSFENTCKSAAIFTFAVGTVERGNPPALPEK